MENIFSIFNVGKKVYFKDEKLPYNVMASSERYAIASRKIHRREDADLIHYKVEMGAYISFKEAFEANKDNPVYSIVDFNKNIRGAENFVFGIYDYFKESDCDKAIKDLESGLMEISHRHRCELFVDFEKSLKSN